MEIQETLENNQNQETHHVHEDQETHQNKKDQETHHNNQDQGIQHTIGEMLIPSSTQGKSSQQPIHSKQRKCHISQDDEINMDPDKLFFLSLVHEFKKVPSNKKMNLKIEILQSIHNAQVSDDFICSISSDDDYQNAQGSIEESSTNDSLQSSSTQQSDIIMDMFGTPNE